MPEPLRGEIWMVDLRATRGREQAGHRPAMVLSADLFNRGPADLVVVLPMTSKAKGIPLHVPVGPPEGGVRTQSYIKCEDIRSISKERLTTRWGRVSADTMRAVEDKITILLDL